MLLYEMFSPSILEKTTPRKVCLFSERPYVEPPEGFFILVKDIQGPKKEHLFGCPIKNGVTNSFSGLPTVHTVKSTVPASTS